MPEWVRITALDRCPPGKLLAVSAGEQEIVLANVDGTIYALEDQCSHANFPLSDGELEGDRLECMYHGATFDVRSGKATQLPAIRSVKVFSSEIRGEDIFLELP